MEMLRPQVQVLLAALLSSVLLVQVSCAPPADMRTETGADLSHGTDLSHLLWKVMSELMAARGDGMLLDLEAEEEEEMGVREEVMRRHLPFSHRERKAGCRNFFWKTFTSC